MEAMPDRTRTLLDSDFPPVKAQDVKERILWMALRQALIIILGAIEDYLEMERSIVPRRKRAA